MKRILIVDDDKDILFMLEYGLKKLEPGYEIVTARGSIEALALVEQKPFDLILTDYMMKSMTGVDLARAARRLFPATQVVLMSAYGSKHLQATSESLGFEAYLEKPFEIQKIREIVKNAFANDTSESDIAQSKRTKKIFDDIRSRLQGLHVSVSARCVLLLSAAGHPIQVVGQTNGLRISNISALIAANFMGTSELANLLGNRSIFQSSFHVGDDYNLYIYDVNDDFLLAVVFDAKRKPGVVWFYTRQTSTSLAPLLEQLDKPKRSKHPLIE